MVAGTVSSGLGSSTATAASGAMVVSTAGATTSVGLTSAGAVVVSMGADITAKSGSNGEMPAGQWSDAARPGGRNMKEVGKEANTHWEEGIRGTIDRGGAAGWALLPG